MEYNIIMCRKQLAVMKILISFILKMMVHLPPIINKELTYEIITKYIPAEYKKTALTFYVMTLFCFFPLTVFRVILLKGQFHRFYLAFILACKNSLNRIHFYMSF